VQKEKYIPKGGSRRIAHTQIERGNNAARLAVWFFKKQNRHE
jgi:hypothetical protein